MRITETSGTVVTSFSGEYAAEKVEMLCLATGNIQPYRGVAIDTGGTNTSGALVGLSGSSDNVSFLGVYEGSGSSNVYGNEGTLPGNKAKAGDSVWVVIIGPAKCKIDGGGAAGDALEVASGGRLTRSDNTGTVASLSAGTNLMGHRGYAMLLEEATGGDIKSVYLR